MAMGVWTTVVIVAATVAILRVLQTFIWEPLRLRRIMHKQGVQGPPFRFVVGNLPEAEAFRQSQPEDRPFEYIFRPTVAPQHSLFFPKYGKRYVYGYGSDTRLAVRDPEFVKEVLMTQSDSFRRTDIEKYIVSQVTDNGIFIIEGQKWYMERHTLNPFFRRTALKDMMEAMVRGASSEIEKWEQAVAQAGGTMELDVVPGIQALSSKVLTYAAFSSAEYEKGDQIFRLQTRIVSLVIQLHYSSSFWIPGYRFLPTKINRELAQCQAKVDKLLYGIINDRISAMKEGRVDSHGTDLLRARELTRMHRSLISLLCLLTPRISTLPVTTQLRICLASLCSCLLAIRNGKSALVRKCWRLWAMKSILISLHFLALKW